MATKRSSKSNKTDHVLNLLSGTAQDEQEKAQEGDNINENTSEKPEVKRAKVPILDMEKTNHENISGTINTALDGLLQKEMQAQNLASSNTNEEESNIMPETQPENEGEVVMQQTSQTNVEVEETKTEAVADVPVKEEQKQAQESQTNSDDIETSHIVNVMEEVVERHLDDYIAKFNVCKCKRCRADIKALSLTKLPAKYVVLSISTQAPMISFYAGRYETQAKNEIIFSCNTIKDNPRHEGFRNNY